MALLLRQKRKMKMSFFKRLRDAIVQKSEAVTQKFTDGLAKTRDLLVEKVEDLVRRYKKIDENFFEELEEILITADVGVNTVMELIDELRSEVRKQRSKTRWTCSRSCPRSWLPC